MALKLSLLAIIGILSLAGALNPKEEECSVLGVDVTVSTVCNDCSSMYICGSSFTTYLVSCAEGTYCSQLQGEVAKCVDQLPTECTPTTTPEPTNPTKPLLCTGSGFYPDPFDCTGFHYCSEYGKPSQFQSCPANHVFDPDFDSMPCKELVDQEADCLMVNCSEISVFKSYGTSSLFYAYCVTDEATEKTTVSMFRCADGTSFDGSRCVFQCKDEGNFANPINDSNYYQCYYSGEELVNRLLFCPGKRKFNETMQICL